MFDRATMLIFTFCCLTVAISVFAIEKNSVEDLNQGIDDGIAVIVEIVLMLLGTIIIAIIAKPDDRVLLVQLFLISFSLRILFSLTIYKFGLVNVLGDEDATAWDVWYRVRDWRDGHVYAGGYQREFLDAIKFGRNIGYQYWAAAIMYILGSPSRFSLALFNCLFGALTVLLIYGIAKMVLGKETATIAAIFAVFLPSLLIWSAQTSKEIIVLFLECLILYTILKLRHKMRLSLMLLVPVSLIAVFAFRFYAAYFCCIAILGLIIQPQKGWLRESFIGIMLLSAVIVIFYTTGIWNNEVERISGYRETKYVQSYKRGFLPEDKPGIEPAGPAPGYGSSVRLPFDTSTTTGTLLSLPIGFLYVMLSPFPWDIIKGSLRMKLTLPELLLWWCLIYYGIIGLRYALKHKLAEAFPILVFLVSLSILYSWLFTNIGLIYRQRVHLMPFILIFAALGIMLKKQKRESFGNGSEVIEANP